MEVVWLAVTMFVIARDAYDWLLFSATALAAVGTVLAVGVALFGPGWLARRRRPRISIDMDGEAATSLPTGADRMDGVSGGPALRLANAVGKEAARDVEISVSLEHRESSQSKVAQVAEDRRLNFADPLTGSPGMQTVDIPPGGSRRASFVLLGWPAVIAERLSFRTEDLVGKGTLVGALSTFPLPEKTVWLAKGHYDARLVLAGSNFDAVAYRAGFWLDFADVQESEIKMPLGDTPLVPANVRFVLTEKPAVITSRRWLL